MKIDSDGCGCLVTILTVVVAIIFGVIDDKRHKTELYQDVSESSCKAVFYHKAGHYSALVQSGSGYVTKHFWVQDDNVKFFFDVDKDEEIRYKSITSVRKSGRHPLIYMEFHLHDKTEIKGGEHQYGIPKHNNFSQTHRIE